MNNKGAGHVILAIFLIPLILMSGFAIKKSIDKQQDKEVEDGAHI